MMKFGLLAHSKIMYIMTLTYFLRIINSKKSCSTTRNVAMPTLLFRRREYVLKMKKCRFLVVEIPDWKNSSMTVFVIL